MIKTPMLTDDYIEGDCFLKEVKKNFNGQTVYVK